MLTAASPLRACVRLRPLTEQEPRETAFVVKDTSRLVVRRDVLQREGRADWHAEMEYAFDAVFGPDVSTAEVYTRAAADIVPWVLRGIHCTILAFGQTASGKVSA